MSFIHIGHSFLHAQLGAIQTSPTHKSNEWKIRLIWMVKIPFISIQNNYLIYINKKTLVFGVFGIFRCPQKNHNFHEINDEEPEVVWKGLGFLTSRISGISLINPNPQRVYLLLVHSISDESFVYKLDTLTIWFSWLYG